MGRVVWLAVLGCLAGCEEAGKPPPATLQRVGRYGSLRDLVLFASTDPVDAEALFVDRFEVTRGDWKEFAAGEVGRACGAQAILSGGEPDLPIAGLDLELARAFAAWRFLRLPRRDEWLVAAAIDGRSRYPWGGRDDPLRANSAELGLGRATPVGTFESGRRGGGDQPYDLIGNVSEWTESVPVAWWQSRDPVAGPAEARRAALATPALAVWGGPAGLLPPAWLVAAGGGRVPRLVVGSDFQTPMDQQTQEVLAADRRDRTGVRLCATARELLANLLAAPQRAEPDDLEQLRRFVRRGRHRQALADALRRRTEPMPQGPVTTCLSAELDGAAASGR
ncbi:MAG: SUMF1/EgtB/PvdO family nonheme iron enzyme [Planctomycetes bacterium]|nr:SUMF1/EgtB/PvdO family nonheme iron enzyme [Planctomycetota bacterium]